MEEVIKAFGNPTVIASIIVTLGGLLISPVVEALRKALVKKGAWILRNLRARELKKIRKQRQNGDEVTFQTIKSHAYLILFFGSIAAYWWLIIFGAAKGIGALPQPVQLFLAFPIYVFEVLWLLQHSKARELVDYRGRLRVTSSSSLRRRYRAVAG